MCSKLTKVLYAIKRLWMERNLYEHMRLDSLISGFKQQESVVSYLHFWNINNFNIEHLQ